MQDLTNDQAPRHAHVQNGLSGCAKGATRHTLPHSILWRPRRSSFKIFNLLCELLHVFRPFPADFFICEPLPFDQIFFVSFSVCRDCSFCKDGFRLAFTPWLNDDGASGRLVAHWICLIWMIRLQVADVQNWVYLHPCW